MIYETELCVYGNPKPLEKFKVVGLLPHQNFQKCRYLIEKLHYHYPKDYAKPEIRAMLNVDWEEFLNKMRRRHGKPYYLLEAPVVVYHNGELMGDHRSFLSHITKKYNLELDLDFEEMAEKELIKHFSEIMNKKKRKFVYFTIAIDEHVIGSMLFMLYNDLVPKTCDNFLLRCTDKIRGYKGTKVHRIARYSWIQCGGFNLEHSPMPCENYSVPHDRRGVLSMCNKKIHVDNSTQFFINLEAAPWMDYNYVAFGQLVQGAEILNLIEKVGTYYENPVRKIEITNCGEFSLCPVPEDEYTKALNPPYETLFNPEIPLDEDDSFMTLTGYKEGKYSLQTDLQSYMPFTRYSKMFDHYLKSVESAVEELSDADRDDVPNDSLFTTSQTFYHRKQTIASIFKPKVNLFKEVVKDK